MGRWHGKQKRGAASALREMKRKEADARNAATPFERTAKARREGGA